MLEIVTQSAQESQDLKLTLDALALQGARKLLIEALHQEVAQYVGAAKEERDSAGRAQVVRNGTARPRKVTLGCGTIEVSAPRVHDKRPEKKFTSSILPPYLKRSQNVEELLPVLYLKGLSTSDFQEALVGILGEGAGGLSSSSISSLKRAWEQDFEHWKAQLINDQFVYVFADGVHVKVRLGEDKKLCLLVIIGVTAQGEKKLIAVEPGHRESTESWSIVLRDLKSRGLKAPMLAIGDGALGFWSAVRAVFPSTHEQRCWVHKIANVLDALPKRLQVTAKSLLHEMMYADTEADANEALQRFDVAFGLKHPKSVEKLKKDWDELTTLFKFPAAHWKHIRSTNPIESTFATVKLRTKVTKGAGSPKAATTMAFKLMIDAQKRWRKISGVEEITRLLNGVAYKDGVVVPAKSDQEAVNS